MNISKFTIVLLFVATFCYSQIEKTIGTGIPQKDKLTFTQFDISLSFQPNDNYGQNNIYGQISEYRFLPVGVASSIGHGIHVKQWIGLSANTGLIFIGNEKLVAIPVYGSLRFSPKLRDNARITLQYGLGQSFALGRGDLSGRYQKISLGIENNEGNILFVSIENHGYRTINMNSQIYTINLGLASVSF